MLVTTAIFLVLGSVAMSNYRTVNDTMVLDSLANKIAVSIRQAQVSGTSAKEDVIGGGSFDYAYGIYFSRSSRTSYIYFVDRNANEHYDSGEEISTYTIGNGNTITNLCVNKKNGTGSLCNRLEMNITFLRPNPDAYIRLAGAAVYPDAEIEVSSPSGKTKEIVIWTTGQINVE